MRCHDWTADLARIVTEYHERALEYYDFLATMHNILVSLLHEQGVKYQISQRLKSVDSIREKIARNARTGKVYRQLSDVEDVCDRVVIYYGGKVQAAGTLKELLATPDAVRITTPVLPRETMERVLEIIRKDISTGEVRVDNPTQNLESYFLQVVEKAKQTAAQTSGAQSGARVAAYLRGDAEARPTTEKVLERLTFPQAAPIAPAPAVETTPKMDEKKLEALTKAEPSPAPTKPAAVSQEPPTDLSKADEKLSSLLGKPK